jgi:8-oxo-dGTP pyrophosphatase MutT (NUDIX family)
MTFHTDTLEIILTEAKPAGTNQRILDGSSEIYTSVAVDHSRVYCPLEFGNYLGTLSKIYLASVVFVRSASGHILMTQRLPGMSFPNSWVAPGGKVDPHESFLTAAVREIEEEVGLTLSADSLEPVLLYESTSEKVENGIDKAKNRIMVMFYICHLSPATSYKYGHLAKEEIPVKVQESEVQAYEWVHEKEFFELLSSQEDNQAELIAKYGQEKVMNFGGIHPNKYNKGVPEGHYLSFLRYYKDLIQQ